MIQCYLEMAETGNLNKKEGRNDGPLECKWEPQATESPHRHVEWY